MERKDLQKKYEPDEYLAEFYWGIGFGITKIDHQILIILPFVIVNGHFKRSLQMNSTFNLWTVENPITVINSPVDGTYIIFKSHLHECYNYTSWDYKTMNLNTIKITMSLN